MDAPFGIPWRVSESGSKKNLKIVVDYSDYGKYCLGMGIMQNKMGRPRKKRSEVKSSIVTVRMNEAEYKRLHREAKKAGQSVSTYLVGHWQKARK